MALPSDTQGADSRLQVRFYKKSVQQEQESIDAGRPIYKDFDFVQICVAGDTLTEIDTYALQNHTGTLQKHGEWAFPVYPTSRSIQGSPATPYIFDDRCRWEDATERIKEILNKPINE